MMTNEDIVRIHEKYQISNTFYLHALGSEDQATSGLPNRLVVYKKDLQVDLCFPLHDFIRNVLDRYQVIST